MSQLRVIVCQVDEQNENEMTELFSFDLPSIDVSELEPETALDELESDTYATGQAILRRLLEARWEEVDRTLVEEYRQGFSP
jgi:hypothetical protein